MALVQFDPFAELNALHDQMNSLFNTGFTAPATSGRLPITDISSDDAGLSVEMHVPGFTQDEISVSHHQGVLEIRGEHKESEEEKKRGKRYVQRESVTEFYRSIALPRSADSDKVTAQLEDGVLKVVVPYKELPEPKKIKISGKATTKKK